MSKYRRRVESGGIHRCQWEQGIMLTLATTSGNRVRCERFWGSDRNLAQSCRQGGRRSRSARNLATRKFDAILRIKFFQFSADASRKQIFHFHAENAGENKQFEIRNATLLVFKARHRFTAGVPTKQLQLDGKVVLRPPLAQAEFPHLGTDDVQLRRLFFDACTLTARRAQSWRLYLTSYEKCHSDVT